MHVKTSPEITVLYLSGIIHRETAEPITCAVEKAIANESRIIILSFERAKALLSDGIRLLISLCDKARAAGKEFHITDLPKEVKYTLQITNLLDLLGFAGSTISFLSDKKISAFSLNAEDIPNATE